MINIFLLLKDFVKCTTFMNRMRYLFVTENNGAIVVKLCLEAVMTCQHMLHRLNNFFT